MLTCACGDPAQEVWFMAWPAWALAHLSNLFFSGAVNAPFGANLLSNTSGTLVGVVLSPVTAIWGPVAATNVALTLAPGLSAWAFWAAFRGFVTWRPALVPAALIFGYSSSAVTSLVFGHVSVVVLVVPPFLFSLLYEIVIVQERTYRRDGLVLAALAVTQFLISPEVLVMCAFLAVCGLLLVAVVGWRRLRPRRAHAGAALGLGTAVAAVALAYPAWFGLAGSQSVSGVLFAIAPISGVALSGFFSPGSYGELADAYVRFGGYEGRVGPPPNYLGWGVGIGLLASLVLGRRRQLTWLLLALALIDGVVALGYVLNGGPHFLAGIWLPWRLLNKLPLFEEILPDQLAPFVTLFVGLLVALGTDRARQILSVRVPWVAQHLKVASGALVVAVAALTVAPLFSTFELPFTVRPTALPAWMAHQAPRLAGTQVLLTVPFAVSGSTQPMLWQAVDDMHFHLAGAGLKTPNANGGPVNQGLPGSARRILSNLTILGSAEPAATGAALGAVRTAIRTWHVNDVVVDGPSRDPFYASGFLTAVLGVAPRYVDDAWVWHIGPHGPTAPAVTGAPLHNCAVIDARWKAAHVPLSMAKCVLAARAAPAG